MLQQAKTRWRGEVATLLAVFLLLCSSAFAQRNPEKDKVERLNRTTSPAPTAKPAPKKQPNSPPPAPPKPPAVVPKEPPTTAPPPAVEKETVAAPEKPAEPQRCGSLTIDFAALKTDVSEDSELHFYINDTEWQKRRVESDGKVILEEIPEGRMMLRIEHPMIDSFSRPYTIAADEPESISPEFNIVRGKITVVSEKAARVLLTGDKRTIAQTTDEDGRAVFYLKLGAVYHLKVMKDGYLLKEESPVRADPEPMEISVALVEIAKKPR